MPELDEDMTREQAARLEELCRQQGVLSLGEVLDEFDYLRGYPGEERKAAPCPR